MTLEMAVSLGFTCIDARGVDGCFHARSSEVGRIELDRSRYAAELSLDVRDHHVPDFEVRSGVLRIYLISGHSGMWDAVICGSSARAVSWRPHWAEISRS